MLSSKKNVNYKRHTHPFIIATLMEFYESDLTFNCYCDQKGLQSKRRSIGRIGTASGIFEMKKNKVSSFFARKKLVTFLLEKETKADCRLKDLSECNKVLTDDEIALVVNTCKELSSMGLGIDEDTCLHVVNTILSERIELKKFKPVTRGVVSRIIKANSDLLKLTMGNSINPKRVRQADTDVRNALFVKLENFIKLLHSQGKIPWKTFADIPPEYIYNMDEVATNTHDHRKRVIACKLDLGRLFQEVVGGDSKMPFHITICITSRADGKF